MIEGLAAVYSPPGPGGPMMRSCGLRPGASDPTAARCTVLPATPTPQWSIAPEAAETLPPLPILLRVPAALKSDTELGVVLSVKKMPLTSWPADVGFGSRSFSTTVIWPTPGVITADALTGPSGPVPEALKEK